MVFIQINEMRWLNFSKCDLQGSKWIQTKNLTKKHVQPQIYGILYCFYLQNLLNLINVLHNLNITKFQYKLPFGLQCSYSEEANFYFKLHLCCSVPFLDINGRAWVEQETGSTILGFSGSVAGTQVLVLIAVLGLDYNCSAIWGDTKILIITGIYNEIKVTALAKPMGTV